MTEISPLAKPLASHLETDIRSAFRAMQLLMNKIERIIHDGQPKPQLVAAPVHPDISGLKQSVSSDGNQVFYYKDSYDEAETRFFVESLMRFKQKPTPGLEADVLAALQNPNVDPNARIVWGLQSPTEDIFMPALIASIIIATHQMTQAVAERPDTDLNACFTMHGQSYNARQALVKFVYARNIRDGNSYEPGMLPCDETQKVMSEIIPHLGIQGNLDYYHNPCAESLHFLSQYGTGSPLYTYAQTLADARQQKADVDLATYVHNTLMEIFNYVVETTKKEGVFNSLEELKLMAMTLGGYLQESLMSLPFEEDDQRLLRDKLNSDEFALLYCARVASEWGQIAGQTTQSGNFTELAAQKVQQVSQFILDALERSIDDTHLLISNGTDEPELLGHDPRLKAFVASLLPQQKEALRLT